MPGDVKGSDLSASQTKLCSIKYSVSRSLNLGTVPTLSKVDDLLAISEGLRGRGPGFKVL